MNLFLLGRKNYNEEYTPEYTQELTDIYYAVFILENQFIRNLFLIKLIIYFF